MADGSNRIGDTNGDSKVDGVDVNWIVKHIIGQTPVGFNRGAADVNCDGHVDITDVTALIELVK